MPRMPANPSETVTGPWTLDALAAHCAQNWNCRLGGGPRASNKPSGYRHHSAPAPSPSASPSYSSSGSLRRNGPALSDFCRGYFAVPLT
eukprot:3163283-Pyramimonas_sp.AAC.1